MEYISGKNIIYYLANTPQITFEVTERCNLSCIYCGYGKMYNNKDPRSNRDLSLSNAITFLNYIKNLWEHGYDTSGESNIHISFYGGEPLLNMTFIRKTINYIENYMAGYGKSFIFSMTTNGLLIPEYMDYLVEKNFHILISLDGDETGDSLRVFHNGSPSYQHVTNSINLLRQSFPNFFESNVNFNSVLSTKNSEKKILDYFYNEYKKIPSISAINDVGINREELKLFETLYKSKGDDYDDVQLYNYGDDYFNNPKLEEIARHLINTSPYIYHDYNELLYDSRDTRKTIPTGTCLPFAKKVFITVSGNIMPCERIGYKYHLGSIKNGEVYLDFDEIANKYNGFYNNASRTCTKCFKQRQCLTCMFNNGQLESGGAKCNYFRSKQSIDTNSKVIAFFSDYPEAYSYIMNHYEVH